MKLFNWAQKKLLPSSAPLNHQQNNADNPFGMSNSSATCGERAGAQTRASRDAYSEVLTIGTLGMGELLSRGAEEEEGDEEEQDDDDDNEEEEEATAQIMCHMADLGAMSSNRASTSSQPASTSSNRDSVSSVDIQKLQEELQNILYFKLGQEHEGGKKSRAPLEAKGKKQKKDRKAASGCLYIHDKQVENADGKSHVPSERGSSMRGVLPLHNFLEMPMDHLINKSTRPPYLLLMQTLKNKFLHHTSPPRIHFSIPLFEKLLKPKVNKDLQHGSTMDKMPRLLRKIMDKKTYMRSRNGLEKYNCGAKKPKHFKNKKEEEELEEQRMKGALGKSSKGSDRFINYITSVMEHTERNAKSFVNDEYLLCHYPYPLTCEEGSHLQLVPLPATSSLENECWIKTDGEYFVLEL